MNYGDFSSVVQLGVGLHVGTALLQLYGEIGEAPLVRKISRIRSLFSPNEQPPAQVREDLEKIESDFAIFKIRFFNEYKKYIKVNAVVAILLVITLATIAFKDGDPIPSVVAILFVALSTLPAPITLAALWLDAEREIGPLKQRADELQDRALRTAS